MTEQGSEFSLLQHLFCPTSKETWAEMLNRFSDSWLCSEFWNFPLLQPPALAPSGTTKLVTQDAPLGGILQDPLELNYLPQLIVNPPGEAHPLGLKRVLVFKNFLKLQTSLEEAKTVNLSQLSLGPSE